MYLIAGMFPEPFEVRNDTIEMTLPIDGTLNYFSVFFIVMVKAANSLEFINGEGLFGLATYFSRELRGPFKP